jgi:hypothetical protein
MGLAALAGGLAFVGSAEAIELVVDGSFENTTPSSKPVVKLGGTDSPAVEGGWSIFSTYLFSTQYTMPLSNGGQQFLRPYVAGLYGISHSNTNVEQTVSLTARTTLTPAKIDAGEGRYTLSAWFCSYLADDDNSDLTFTFLDAANAAVGDPIVIGGYDFVAALPYASNGRYANSREWGQDPRTGTIPAGARNAKVVIQSHLRSGAGADGYVDLVSLDVVDAGATTPVIASANPPDGAVSVGPVVEITVGLQDRVSQVNTNLIRFYLDDVLKSPSIEKVDANTTVRHSAGLLPALTDHSYQIAFSDNGTPVATKTNRFRFKVADYLTLPASSASPVGSEDVTKPGFNVKVYQVPTLADDPAPIQPNLEDSIELTEGVLAGLAGDNVADLSGAATGNTYFVQDTVHWANSSGTSPNFPDPVPFPGIPGTLGTEESFIHEVLTFVRFPASGYYQMGVNNNDHFRLSVGAAGVQALRLLAPTNVAIPCVPIATNITELQFGGSLPLTPLIAPVVYATPSGNPDDSCNLATNTALAGKIALLDRGGTNCTSDVQALQAQLAGAVAVLETTPGDTGYPFRLGDINPGVKIPVLVIAENFGAGLLKSYLTNGTPVTAMILGDAHPRIAEWDAPKGFGNVDVLAGFAVPAPGVYPLRLLAGHEGSPGGAGAANLDWFSFKSDGTKVLVNDTSDSEALRAYRARNAGSAPTLNSPTAADGSVTIGWTGVGLLEEATAVNGPWYLSPVQNNPQTLPATGLMKFYRVRQ